MIIFVSYDRNHIDIRTDIRHFTRPTGKVGVLNTTRRYFRILTPFYSFIFLGFFVSLIPND